MPQGTTDAGQTSSLTDYRSFNALCESFFATLECELIDRTTFRSQAAAKMEVFAFIEGWYNPRRLHSGIGYASPQSFEQALAESEAA